VGEVKSSTYIRRKWKIILRKLPGVIGEARNATSPFEVWNCLNTDKILDNTVLHTNPYILIQSNFSHASDAKLLHEPGLATAATELTADVQHYNL
jgi:hypothetical protein